MCKVDYIKYSIIIQILILALWVSFLNAYRYIIFSILTASFTRYFKGDLAHFHYILRDFYELKTPDRLVRPQKGLFISVTVWI